MANTSLIYVGAQLRVRWMRYKGDFPAKSFLIKYPEDLQALLARVEEMGDTGTLCLVSKGHSLKGKFRDLFVFKMPLTRAFGFRHLRDFIVTNAALKAGTSKAQNPDYERALKMRSNYLEALEKG